MLGSGAAELCQYGSVPSTTVHAIAAHSAEELGYLSHVFDVCPASLHRLQY